MPDRKLYIVVTTMASDSHTWNLVYLQLLLQEWGHEVTNLGPCAPDGLILETCHVLSPDLVVISSLNGHGFGEGMRVINKLRQCPGLDSTPIVIGGKLGTSEAECARHAAGLTAAGFDLVAGDGDEVRRLRTFVDSIRMREAC